MEEINIESMKNRAYNFIFHLKIIVNDFVKFASGLPIFLSKMVKVRT